MKAEAQIVPTSAVRLRHRLTLWLATHRSSVVALTLLVCVALTLRLLVWRWREFYDLGGDEREYLDQAIKLLQLRRYEELRLMRPPLYTLFLAASIQLFDSLVQNLRLVQAVLSALTLVPMWLLASELHVRSSDEGRRTKDEGNEPFYRLPSIALVACTLMALSYTLAANATELLSETLFLFGLTTFFWLILRAARSSRSGERSVWGWAALAGLCLGLLCLVRSVAQPLIPLGALWLFAQFPLITDERRKTKDESGARESRQPTTDNRQPTTASLLAAICFVCCSLLVILPWTIRNYVTYGAVILIDTTGAENLWLDNNPTASTTDDPLGREDAKRQLYALGDDRAARQRIASQRGIEAITGNSGWFASKAYGELLKFFALEYTDDMRARPVIWHPLTEVWMRLLLGDGLWLVLLFGGITGLVLVETVKTGGSQDRRQETGDRRQKESLIIYLASRVSRLASRFGDARFLFVPWLLYIVLTAMIFHVELRYRLPIYPVLILYTAASLAAPRRLAWRPLRVGVGLIVVTVCCALTLLHAPYPSLAWQIGWKQYHLWQAERALLVRDASDAEAQARAAAMLDEESALAQVALARAAVLRNNREAARAAFERAIQLKRAHPYAHLLLGDLQRSEGQEDAARQELAFETGSLEDLQRWSWERFITPPLSRLNIGDGLDLGFLMGFYPAEQGGWRWTHEQARLRLRVPAGGEILRLRLQSGRTPNAPPPSVHIFVGEREIGSLRVASEWSVYTLPLPESVQGTDCVIKLVSDTFAPRSYDPTSSDGRTLGVMVDWAEVAR